MNPRVIVKTFTMDALDGREKTVRIFLPKSYHQTDIDYPVLYMHDGQNLIDKSPYSHHSWNVMETMDELGPSHGEMIIVGLDSHENKRIQEYSPYLKPNIVRHIKSDGIPAEEIKPEADEYGHFLTQQVKPFVDQNYRTLKAREHTFIAGSSCGGIISIYLGLVYQDTFSVIGAFSPAYVFMKRQLFAFLKQLKVTEPMRLYHDMGSKESGGFSFVNLQLQRQFDKLMRAKIPPKDLVMVVDKGAMHNEYYWAKRFKYFYRFCLE